MWIRVWNLLNSCIELRINVFYNVNFKIFREIHVTIIKFKKYLLQNCKTGWIIAWINKKFLNISALDLNLK